MGHLEPIGRKHGRYHGRRRIGGGATSYKGEAPFLGIGPDAMHKWAAEKGVLIRTLAAKAHALERAGNPHAKWVWMRLKRLGYTRPRQILAGVDLIRVRWLHLKKQERIRELTAHHLSVSPPPLRPVGFRGKFRRGRPSAEDRAT